jgi:hypothetical protein
VNHIELNLHEWVPEHRGELVAAALTIVRAYLAAGEPKVDVPNFARFEDWSRLVRKPLVWLGMPDPCLTRRAIEERDPVREKLTALLSAWRAVFATTAATVAEAIAAAYETLKNDDLLASSEPRYPALKEAIVAIADERGKVNSRRLASFINAHVGRFEGELRFERAGSRQGVALWTVGSVGRQERARENCHGPNDRNSDSFNKPGVSDPPNPRNGSDGSAQQPWSAVI